MTYRPGERVALEHTNDARLRPGDEGTVRRHDADRGILDVDW
ncbi:DUF4314 domain-containing protein, partial [Micromonospora sp. 4G55]|nr:DUF4314 domain-containing protein [Micromonospora sp. 4G55]